MHVLTMNTMELWVTACPFWAASPQLAIKTLTVGRAEPASTAPARTWHAVPLRTVMETKSAITESAGIPATIRRTAQRMHRVIFANTDSVFVRAACAKRSVYGYGSTWIITDSFLP